MYNTANSGSKFEISGSPTEKAILLWAIEELKLDQEKQSGVVTFFKVRSSVLRGNKAGFLQKGRKDLDHEQKLEFMQIIKDKHEMLKDGLILTGIIGISNPCREGVKRTMQNFQSAGVNIQMITGDDMFNAKAIATECGLLTPERVVVIEGLDFRNYSEEERMEKADKLCVMATASPSDKLLMVQCLKE
ncbi:hypothetical protein TIFTF001_052984 [Ficus carica]|uniref:Uncharacterized protein n=1 Tax=Ficus carica TaxID=3494 RepID=A0AA88JG30_FICCA|nr:hypothetical protein TIFTF001_052984 [Ficus carica]